jgi:hypothetical protein
MTTLDAITEIESGIAMEMSKRATGHPAEYWQDSTRNGLALANEICMTVRMRCIREQGEKKEHDHERS